MGLPPYEVPDGDADLLEVGCVLTPERLVDTWAYNAVADCVHKLVLAELCRDARREQRTLANRHLARIRGQVADLYARREFVRRALRGPQSARMQLVLERRVAFLTSQLQRLWNARKIWQAKWRGDEET